MLEAIIVIELAFLTYKLLIDFGLVGLLFYIFLIIKLFLVKKEVRFLLIFISISCITLDFYWPTKIAYSLILAMCYFDKKNYLKKIYNITWSTITCIGCHDSLGYNYINMGCNSLRSYISNFFV